MKIKLSTIIAVSVIVLLFAGVAYTVTNRPAVEAKQRGNQHKTISSQEGPIEKKRLIQRKQHEEQEHEAYEDHEHVLVNFQGEVTEVDLAEGNSFKIKTEDNNVYKVKVGSRWFWEKEGIDISKGDELLVRAVKDEEENEDPHYGAITIRNITTGKTATLRTPEGKPLWW